MDGSGLAGAAVRPERTGVPMMRPGFKLWLLRGCRMAKIRVYAAHTRRVVVADLHGSVPPGNFSPDTHAG